MTVKRNRWIRKICRMYVAHSKNGECPCVGCVNVTALFETTLEAAVQDFEAFIKKSGG